MARTWLSVTVDLLGGRGDELWPWPGRIFAVGPSHTFEDLADAINDSFGRWDRSHLSLFTLDDGRVITDDDTGVELSESPGGLLLVPLDIATAKVTRTVKPGAEFQFVYDLGDEWTHRCVVAEKKVDPMDVLGIVPSGPLPYWGWGSIPDQYGRRWADDDGESRPPRRPARMHPMLSHTWPSQQNVPVLDVIELRQAVAARDAGRFLRAVAGRDIDDALQQVGRGVPMALAQQRADAEPVALSVVNRLISRGGDGDRVLADDLLALLRREPLSAHVLPVDLELLSMIIEVDLDYSAGGYLDLRSGEVYNDSEADPMMVGEDAAIDVDADPDRWLHLERLGPRAGWEDMAAFAERQRDHALRERLEHAIEGRGAFRRFRDLVHDEDLADQWFVFSTDRQIGRAREYLADAGIRAG